MRQPVAKVLEALYRILAWMACPWSCACDPPPPLIKVASNTRPYSKLGGTTLNGREEGGQYHISKTCDQARFAARKVLFSLECLNIFATGCSVRLFYFNLTKRSVEQCHNHSIISRRPVTRKVPSSEHRRIAIACWNLYANIRHSTHSTWMNCSNLVFPFLHFYRSERNFLNHLRG